MLEPNTFHMLRLAVPSTLRMLANTWGSSREDTGRLYDRIRESQVGRFTFWRHSFCAIGGSAFSLVGPSRAGLKCGMPLRLSGPINTWERVSGLDAATPLNFIPALNERTHLTPCTVPLRYQRTDYEIWAHFRNRKFFNTKHIQIQESGMARLS